MFYRNGGPTAPKFSEYFASPLEVKYAVVRGFAQQMVDRTGEIEFIASHNRTACFNRLSDRPNLVFNRFYLKGKGSLEAPLIGQRGFHEPVFIDDQQFNRSLNES